MNFKERLMCVSLANNGDEYVYSSRALYKAAEDTPIRLPGAP